MFSWFNDIFSSIFSRGIHHVSPFFAGYRADHLCRFDRARSREPWVLGASLGISLAFFWGPGILDPDPDRHSVNIQDLAGSEWP